MANKNPSFQTIGTILALARSVIALLTSIYEVNIMNSQQRAMVWPHLKVYQNYSSEGFRIKGSNYGTGPAIVKSVEVTIDGEPVKDINDFLDSMVPGRTMGYDVIGVGDLNSSVFKPEEDRDLLYLPWNEETHALVDQLYKVNLVVCYESVLGDSWYFDLKDGETREGKFESRLEFDN
ncbi:MAG: hypothetical protein AAFP08_12400 [Bacteroidota bacterium]